MANFCTGCGKQLTDGLAFCTECGSRVSDGNPADVQVSKGADATVTQAPVQTEAKQTPTAVNTQPPKQYVPPVQPAQPVENNTVSTAYFFWMMLVFSLPVIGWIICLNTAFAPKNESKKHFARAILIWAIIGIIISILLGVALLLMGEAIMGYIPTSY